MLFTKCVFSNHISAGPISNSIFIILLLGVWYISPPPIKWFNGVQIPTPDNFYDQLLTFQWVRLNLWSNVQNSKKYVKKSRQSDHMDHPPFQTKIYLVKVPLNVQIVKQHLHTSLETVFEKFMKWGLKVGILIIVDNGPDWCYLMAVGVFFFLFF